MFERIKGFFKSISDNLKAFLDRWIAKLGLEPIEPNRGLFARVWHIADHYRSGSLFLVATLAIGLVVFLGGAFLMKAAFAMLLVFVGLFIILMQLSPEKRRIFIATLVKNRLVVDIAATVLGLWAVFGAVFGVTTSFIWAFTLLGVSAMLSTLDWYGKSVWGKDYQDAAWKPKLLPDGIVEAEFHDVNTGEPQLTPALVVTK